MHVGHNQQALYLDAQSGVIQPPTQGTMVQSDLPGNAFAVAAIAFGNAARGKGHGVAGASGLRVGAVCGLLYRDPKRGSGHCGCNRGV